MIICMAMDKQSQIDKVVRLPNSVRDSPTPQTPSVPSPTPAAANDPVGLVAARTAFIEQAERAREVLKDARHRKWAKAISKYALGGESARFWAEDDAGKLAKIVQALKNDFEANGLDLGVFDLSKTDREVHPAVNGVLYDTLAHIVAEGSAAEMFLEGAGDASDRDGRRALIDLAKGCIPIGLITSHMEEYMTIRYEAKVDPRKALTLEHRLVKENTTPGWFPDEDSRKMAMVERLDPEFYRALLDKYPLEADLAKVSLRELVHQITAVYISWATRQQRVHGTTLAPGGTGGVTGALVATEEPGGGDGSANDDNQRLLRQILEKMKYIEAYVKSTGGHTAVTQAAKRQRGGLAGFRNGVAPTVGFDVNAKKALPLCTKCSVGGKKFYHLYRDCERGGRRHTPGTAAAYCQPAAEVTKEDSEYAALAFRFQQAADDGVEAFAAAAEAYGAPEVLSGEQAGGLDLSAYGFAVDGQADAGERDLRDPELVRLSREVDAAATRCGVSFTQVSVPPPVVPGPVAAVEPVLGSMLVASEPGGAVRQPQTQIVEPTGEFSGQVVVLDEAAAEAQQVAEREAAILQMRIEDRQVTDARERSVAATLSAPTRDAEDLFQPAGWQPDDEKKEIEEQAVVPARSRRAVPQPVGCGASPFGASQRLMWTVCMLGMFVCAAGALRVTELGAAGGGAAHLAEGYFTDEHGRVWFYPGPVEVTFGRHDIDGWEHRLQAAVSVLTTRVRDVLPPDGGAAADGGALAAGGAHGCGSRPFDVAENFDEAAVLGDYEDVYKY
ncbi:hypothetical protein CYMTET_10744 [Cymbomonas tetramitiformis]|uniref:Uncharacterized protein n=1 Tax=Cymbomonas tetramitiformis TaxID=36881 RepID=A0AAE0LDV6_9CHLO|nr:hypothetical protein CYMTET_10744 [Cymbomonas tetramitiformis]